MMSLTNKNKNNYLNEAQEKFFTDFGAYTASAAERRLKAIKKRLTDGGVANVDAMDKP